MRAKGVSPLLATVLIVLVVVSLSGTFLIYSQRTGTQLTETGTQQQQTFQREFQAPVAIEGVAKSKIFLKNLGEINITSEQLSIFLDEELINFTLSSPIQPSQTGTIRLDQTWKLATGEHMLRVTSGALSDSVRVRVRKPEGLVGHWMFDEASGTVAVDTRGNTNGTLYNGSVSCSGGDCPQWVEGKFGRALEFDGVNDYVNVPDTGTSALDVARVTIEAWIRIKDYDTDADHSMVINKESAYEYGLEDLTGRLQGAANPPCWRWAGTPVIPLNVWTHTAVVFNGTHELHYVDGKLNETLTCNGDIGTNDHDLRIAARGGDGFIFSMFNGAIDEVRVFDRALSPSEIGLTPEELYSVDKV